jgi:hypothetical protein
MDWLYFLQTVFRDSGVNVTSEHLVYVGSHTYIRYILHLFKYTDSRLLGKIRCRGIVIGCMGLCVS